MSCMYQANGQLTCTRASDIPTNAVEPFGTSATVGKINPTAKVSLFVDGDGSFPVPDGRVLEPFGTSATVGKRNPTARVSLFVDGPK